MGATTCRCSESFLGVSTIIWHFGKNLYRDSVERGIPGKGNGVGRRIAPPRTELPLPTLNHRQLQRKASLFGLCVREPEISEISRNKIHRAPLAQSVHRREKPRKDVYRLLPPTRNTGAESFYRAVIHDTGKNVVILAIYAAK